MIFYERVYGFTFLVSLHKDSKPGIVDDSIEQLCLACSVDGSDSLVAATAYFHVSQNFCLLSKYSSSLRVHAVQSLCFFQRRWTTRKRWHEHTIVQCPALPLQSLISLSYCKANQVASRACIFKRIHLEAKSEGQTTRSSRVEIIFDTMTDERNVRAIHFRRYTRPAGVEIEDGALRTNKDINQRMTFGPRHGGQTNELEAKDSIAHFAIEGDGVGWFAIRSFSRFGVLWYVRLTLCTTWSALGFLTTGPSASAMSSSVGGRMMCSCSKGNPVDSDSFDNMSNPFVHGHLFEGCNTHFDDVGVDLVVLSRRLFLFIQSNPDQLIRRHNA
ncbi:hypothetical protein KCU92_g112, partial [Aureobasidium melanogenum]